MNGLALFLAIYTATEVQKLSHDDWKVRETASTNLANLMPLSDQFLSHSIRHPHQIGMGMGFVQPIGVIATHLRHGIDPRGEIEPRNLETAGTAQIPLRLPLYPLLPDSPCSDDGFWIVVDLYEDYRLATILWIEDQLRAGVSEADVIKGMVEGVEYERKWLEERANIEQWGEMLREALGSELIGKPREQP